MKRATVCVILAAGEYYEESIDIPHDALVIAADGGYDYALAHNIEVDIVVGDFDSVQHERPQSIDTLQLPVQKDDPDLLTALKIGWLHGARCFHVYGGCGGRLDHTLANVQMMALIATQGGIGFLHGDKQIVTAIHDGQLDFAPWIPQHNRIISVFAHSDMARGVSEPGLRYELDHATMTNTQVNGLSNEFRDGVAGHVLVEHGTLIVVFPTEAPQPAVQWAHPREGSLGEVSTEISAVLVQD